MRWSESEQYLRLISFYCSSQISPDGCRGFDSGLAALWEIATSCYTNIGQFWKWKVLFVLGQALIQRRMKSSNVYLNFTKMVRVLLDMRQQAVQAHLFFHYFSVKKSESLVGCLKKVGQRQNCVQAGSHWLSYFSVKQKKLFFHGNRNENGL